MKIKLLDVIFCGLIIGCSSVEAKDYNQSREVAAHTILFDLYRGSINQGIKPTLEHAGFLIKKSDVSITEQSLQAVEVLWIATDSGREYQTDEIKAIKSFVKNGGTLICSGQAWAWGGDKKDINAFPLNQLGKELGFTITGLNIGEPSIIESSLYMNGIESLTRTDWWPSKVEPLVRNYQVLVRDQDDKPMALFIPMGKGRIFVFGNSGLLWDNPKLVLNILNNK